MTTRPRTIAGRRRSDAEILTHLAKMLANRWGMFSAAIRSDQPPPKCIALPVAFGVDFGNCVANDFTRSRRKGKSMGHSRSGRSVVRVVTVAVVGWVFLVCVRLPLAEAVSPVTLLAGLERPAAVAVDTDGTIYFSDRNTTDNARVRKLERGATTATTLFEGLNGANYAAVDSEGTLYVSEYRGGGIWRLPKGATTPVRLFSANYPKGIAVDAPGNVYYSTTGAINKLPVGSDTPITLLSGLTDDPEGVSANAVGDVYWITFEGSLNVLRNGQSTPVQLATGLGRQTAGLAVDAAGNAFYALYESISKVAAGTSASEFVASASQPVDVEIDSAGNVVYAEYGLAGSDGPGALTQLPGAGSPAGDSAKNDPRNIPAGTDPNVDWWRLPDSDLDGIPDYWETNGAWVNNTKLDLAAAGAAVGQKDLFVYLDYEQGNQLERAVLDQVTDAFANSPMRPRVQVHFIDGSPIPSNVAETIGWSQQNGPYAAHLGVELSNAARAYGFIGKGWNGDTRVPALAKYFVNLAYRSTSDRTIGVAGIRGGGGWVAYNAPSMWERLFSGQWSDEATHFSEAANLMHEIGHTLGLDHYGDHPCANWADVGNDRDNPTCNAGATDYKSVMSYAYNVLGVPEYAGAQPNRTRIDYSIDRTPWYDWTAGPAVGYLTLVLGQYGEDGNFYDRARGQGLDPSSVNANEAESFDEIARQTAPDAFDGFAHAHAVQGRPDFPVVTGNTHFVVESTPVTGKLTAYDNAASQISLVIDHSPAHGILTTDGLTFTYTPASGYTGDDTATVRATDSKVSSQPVVLSFTRETTPPLPCTGSFCPGS